MDMGLVVVEEVRGIRSGVGGWLRQGGERFMEKRRGARRWEG